MDKAFKVDGKMMSAKTFLRTYGGDAYVQALQMFERMLDEAIVDAAIGATDENGMIDERKNKIPTCYDVGDGVSVCIVNEHQAFDTAVS